jgi:Carboxypeptidase regulatory-like domain
MKSFLFIFSILICVSISAQEKGGIRGFVKDSETAEPLPFVKILLFENDSIQGRTFSDMDGRFYFPQLEEKLWRLEFRYVGYTLMKVDSIVEIANIKTTLAVDLMTSPICCCSFEIDSNKDREVGVFER